jgi:dihydroneopterin aldolase
VNPTESDSLFIEALELDCIVGIRPAERRRPQRVRVDVRLMLDLARAGRSGRFGHTVDYSLVVEEISRLLHFREYRLVEMATEEIAGMLFAAHPLLDAVAIRLEKPEALGGRARTAAAAITRTRAHFPVRTRSSGSARVDTLLETDEAVLETVSLPPGASLECAAEQHARAIAWLASGSLLFEDERRSAIGAPLPAGARLAAGADGACFFRCALR